MYLRHIKLTNFRNYQFQAIDFSERLNLISGLLPAIPLILIRPFLPESPVWQQKRTAGTLKRPSLAVARMPDVLLYAFIGFLVKAAVAMKFTTALLPNAALSGLTDMDAIALTLARSVTDQTVSAPVAARGIIVAAIANSVLKGVLAASLGSPALRWRVLVVMALTTAAGVASFFLI